MFACGGGLMGKLGIKKEVVEWAYRIIILGLMKPLSVS